MASQTDRHASSTGQALTGGAWLDVHFAAARPEYEVQLRAVGIQPGWRVLDAACGSGSFLPWLAELVGPTGSLAALDLAPENVALVERLAEWALPCAVEAQLGNVLALPYPDDAFDAVWFANTSQYLTDAELATALAEFRRVVRPGGLVAVKETDPTAYRVEPAQPGLILRYSQAAAKAGNVQVIGTLRAPALPRWLRVSGLTDVWRRSTLIERVAPHSPVVNAWLGGLFTYCGTLAANLELPPDDREFWGRMRDSAARERFLSDPECWFIEMNVLTVGMVPSGTEASA